MEGFHLTGTLLVFMSCLLTFVGNIFLPFWVNPPQLFCTFPFLIPPLQLVSGIIFTRFKYKTFVSGLCLLLTTVSTAAIIYGHVGVITDLLVRGETTNSDWMNMALFWEAFLLSIAAMGQIMVVLAMVGLVRDARMSSSSKAYLPVAHRLLPGHADPHLVRRIVFLSFLQGILVTVTLYVQVPAANAIMPAWFVWLFVAPFLVDWPVALAWWFFVRGQSIYLYLAVLEYVWSVLGLIIAGSMAKTVLANLSAISASVVGTIFVLIVAVLLIILRILVGVALWKMNEGSGGGEESSAS